MTKEQPAFKNYFLSRAYTDVINTIVDAWCSNGQSVRRCFGKIAYQFGRRGFLIFRLIKVIFYLFQIISIYIFGSLLCIALSSIHFAVITALASCVYLALFAVGLADKLFLHFHRIFGACPKCKEKYDIPTYICKCGREHTALFPNIYGIFRHKCLCGEKLPAVFFLGRNRIKAKCPVCGCTLKTDEASPLCITVIGGPSVGKTCFISAVMTELINDALPLSDFDVKFYDDKNRIAYEGMASKYKSGELQTKTFETNPAALNFFISKKGFFHDRLIYFYDVAGEAFTSSGDLAAQKQYKYCQGFIFIIDPLTLPHIRDKYSARAEYSSFGAGTLDISDTFDTFAENLKRISGLSANHLINMPCAVVLNKADAFDLENQIGTPAAKQAVSEGKFRTESSAINGIVRNFLLDNGMNNFVNNIELCFKNVRYFSCSALGRVKGKQGFTPIRTFDPFYWIISRVDHNLAFNLLNYKQGKIKAVLPNKRFFIGDAEYFILAKTRIDKLNYYCLAPCDSDGALTGDVVIASGNLRKSDVLSFLEDKNTALYQKVSAKLDAERWRRKIQFLNETRTKTALAAET